MQTNLLTDKQASQGTSDAIAAAAGASSPKDLFTTLLVAQIKNQNPLEPTDPSAFVNQLTQMSQMESLQNLASQNKANATALESLRTLGLGAQVGSQVMVKTTDIKMGQDPVEGVFTLGSASAKTALVLTDAAGANHRIELGTRSAGEARFSIDPIQLGLPEGHYTVSVDNSNGETAPIEIAGTLQSVKLSPAGGVVLDIAHIGEVAPTAITRYNGRSAS